jgi:hypothetical protein
MSGLRAFGDSTHPHLVIDIRPPAGFRRSTAMSSKPIMTRGSRKAVSVGLSALFISAGVLVTPGAAQAASCGSQAVTNADDGYIVLGEDADLQKAPYAACGTNIRAKAGTKIWSWCTVENDYGNTWLWGRIAGTETYGWVYVEHASEVVEQPTKNDGWCPNEQGPNDDEIDGPDKIVVVTPAPDADDALPVQEFDAATDVDPTAPPVGGKENGAEPAADYIAPEGDQANSPDEATAATFSAAAVTAAASVKYGAPIARTKVIARARNWYSRNVPYVGHNNFAWDVNHGKKYRTDCSGFVSMAWALRSSRDTHPNGGNYLGDVAHRVNWSQLKPGDMVLRNDHHVQLFEKWANKAKTSFWIYEEGSQASDMNHYKVKLASAKSNGYKPWMYNKIRG